MEKMILESTEDTPHVILNGEDGKCIIEGMSLPEDAMSFYLPIIIWLKKFGNSSVNNITFDFKLDYYNTASAKQITKLMLTLQQLSKTKTTKINWHFYIDDIDIKSSGARFKKLIKTDIELMPYYD